VNFSFSLPPRISAITLAPVYLCCLLIYHSAPAQPEQGNLETLKSETDRWLQIEREIASDRLDWRAEREVLESSHELLILEKNRSLRELEMLESANAVYMRNRDNLENKLQREREARTQLADKIDQIEKRLSHFVLRLPRSFQTANQSLSSLLETNEEIGIPARVQNIVSLMSRIDQFNNRLTLTREIRQKPDGREVSVKVLYWGLARGFAVNIPGDEAWILKPLPEGGWVWEQNNNLADKIIKLQAIHENDQTPELMELPVALKEHPEENS